MKIVVDLITIVTERWLMEMKRNVICVLMTCTLLLGGCGNNSAKEVPKADEKPTASFTAGKKIDSDDEKATASLNSENVEKESLQEIKTDMVNESYIEPSKENNEPAVIKQAKEDSKTNAVNETPSQTKTEVTSPPAVKEEPPTPPVQETKPAEVVKEPEPVVETFDVSPYISQAQSYAQSIGLQLDSSAVDCWDNPISANAHKANISGDIQSRLNRYKNAEGCTGVWIWPEKISESEYDIYIGYY